MATLAVLTQGMILGSEGQTLVSPDDGSRTAQTQPSSPSLLAAQERRQPSYQVFAYRYIPPVITVVNETTLEVGGKQSIDVSRLDQLATPEKETLAGQLDVPVAVVVNLLNSLTNQAPANATAMAGKLRVTVVDYKYLLERWTQYHPPTGKEQVKTDALLALQGGELDKVWGMYIAMPRPSPPTSLRIAG